MPQLEGSVCQYIDDNDAYWNFEGFVVALDCF